MYLIYIYILWAMFDSSREQIPDCFFNETVNLTGVPRFNGSYLYQGVLIPEHLTGEFNYELLYGNERIKVLRHVRGCICKLKPCIQLCCPLGFAKSNENRTCVKLTENSEINSNSISITNENGKRETVELQKDVFVQQFIPCKNRTGSLPMENWHLFTNGTLTFIHAEKTQIYEKSNYCMSPNIGNYTLHPRYCPTDPGHSFYEKTKICCMIFSAICYLLTIGIYWTIPLKRNRFDTCLIFYCFSMAVAFTLNSLPQILWESTSPIACEIIGFVTYFFLISAFLWLNAISFDVFKKLNAKYINNVKHRIVIYCCYAWGVAGVMTLLTYCAEHSNLDENLKPGINGNRCMVNVETNVAFIYLHGPLLIILLFNTLMFVSIYKQIKRSTRMFTNEANSRRVGKTNDNFKVFFRLFFFMGIIWILEVISFLVKEELATDFILALTGAFMFMILISKQSLWKAFNERKKRHNYQSSIGVGKSPKATSILLHSRSSNN